MRYDTHTIGASGIISVRMRRDDGSFHRYCVTPGYDVSEQPVEVRRAAEKAWTPEVVAAYEALRDGDAPGE